MDLDLERELILHRQSDQRHHLVPIINKEFMKKTFIYFFFFFVSLSHFLVILAFCRKSRWFDLTTKLFILVFFWPSFIYVYIYIYIRNRENSEKPNLSMFVAHIHKTFFCRTSCWCCWLLFFLSFSFFCALSLFFLFGEKIILRNK